MQTTSHSSCGHPSAPSLPLFFLLQSWHDFRLVFTSQPKFAISDMHSSLGFGGLGGAAEQSAGRANSEGSGIPGVSIWIWIVLVWFHVVILAWSGTCVTVSMANTALE